MMGRMLIFKFAYFTEIELFRCGAYQTFIPDAYYGISATVAASHTFVDLQVWIEWVINVVNVFHVYLADVISNLWWILWWKYLLANSWEYFLHLFSEYFHEVYMWVLLDFTWAFTESTPTALIEMHAVTVVLILLLQVIINNVMTVNILNFMFCIRLVIIYIVVAITIMITFNIMR